MKTFNSKYAKPGHCWRVLSKHRKYTSVALLGIFLFLMQANASASLVSPSANENVTTASPEFVWQDQSDATHFQVQVRDVSNGNTNAKWWKRADVCDGTTCRSTVPGVNLEHSKNHWWRARVRTSAGWQAWTAPVSRFHYPDSPAGTISVLGPQGVVTESNPKFTWNHIEGVTHYRIWAKDFVTDERTVFANYTAADICDNGLCELDAGNDFSADDNTDHQWMIRALNSGGWNEWSSRYRFTVADERRFNLPPPTDEPQTVEPVTTSGNQVLYDGKAKGYSGNSLFWSNTGWHQDGFYNEDVIVELKNNWNSKIIRAAMGVDYRDPGSYLNTSPTNADDSYVNENEARVRAVVEAAYKHGMYVIIDWHSHYAHETTDAAIEFFDRMSAKYGHRNNVIYEIYNEPKYVSSTMESLPPNQKTWATWNGQIRNYADTIIKTIRANDPDNLIVVGTGEYSQHVDDAANNPFNASVDDDYKNIAYTLHFYADSHGKALIDKAQYALNAGIPLFVTEWGTTDALGRGDPNEARTIRWLNFLYDNNISNVNWNIGDKRDNTDYVNGQAVPGLYEGSSALERYGAGGAPDSQSAPRNPKPDNAWTDYWLTDSGELVKRLMIERNDCVDSRNSNFSTCQTTEIELACFDVDANGWGWNGFESCQVGVVPVPPTPPTPENPSDPECIDTDGDGWGWDGTNSCRVGEAPTHPETPTEPECVDDDGDGWGWDGNNSCRVDADPQPSQCVDTDPVGDGWGWDGVQSCRVDAVCVDTVPVGDGWGWNGTQSCRV